MPDNDIEKIREILHFKGRDDLSELLTQSKSKVQVSSTYGSKLHSLLSTFEIYSSIEYTEMLRGLSKGEHDLILSAIKEVYPIKDSSPEIMEIQYYFNSSMENNNLDSAYSFWSDIHIDISRVSKKLFVDEYYAESVFAAFKQVNLRVKKIIMSKIGEELDGKSLMFKAFNLQDLVIKLSNCSNETERNIQEGYMHLFAGSMQGIRNPKAHELVEIGNNRAKHFLYLASLLMSKIDESQQLYLDYCV
ncbi:MAG TPA: TIGR02391 family protein [bacterium]|nr:TIGR02391 family protein [bacterium]